MPENFFIYAMLLEKIPEELRTEGMKQELQAIKNPQGRAEILKEAAIQRQREVMEFFWNPSDD